MFFNQCCCEDQPSSSSGGSSGGPPPEELENDCRGQCTGDVIPRNFRVAWDWQPTIHEGEITLSTDDSPFTDDFWHVLTYGSVCTSKYKTGGWLLKFKEYVGAYPQYAGCTWESDERIPRINHTTNAEDDPYSGTGYPAYCTEIATQPICRLTIGDGIFAASNTFVLEVFSPVTDSPTYPSVSLKYSGRIVAEDGKTDCMAAITLSLVPGSGVPVFRGYPSGIAFQDGSPAWIPDFVFNGAYYDPAYTFDDNALDPDDPIFAYYFNFPPLPTTCVITPA